MEGTKHTQNKELEESIRLELNKHRVELLYFKRDNYSLQREISMLKQVIETLQWNYDRLERRLTYELQQLRGEIQTLILIVTRHFFLIPKTLLYEFL